MNCGKIYAAVVPQYMFSQNFFIGGIIKLVGGMPAKLSFSQFRRHSDGKDLRLPPMKVVAALICWRATGKLQVAQLLYSQSLILLKYMKK